MAVGKFRRLLKRVYAYPYEAKSYVKRLVDLYTEEITSVYTDDWESALKVLSYSYVYQMELNDNLEDLLTKMICDRLKVASTDDWQDVYGKFKKESKERKGMRTEFLEHFGNVSSDIRYIMNNCDFWYVYHPEGYFKATGKVEKDNAPRFAYLLRWIPSHEMQSLTTILYTQKHKFSYTSLWSKSKFMFATKVGVFDCITGLYSAKTTLLRFDKYKDYCVWHMNDAIVMNENQNEQLLLTQAVVSDFVDMLHKKPSRLYVHFQLIPAILQLTNQSETEDAITDGGDCFACVDTVGQTLIPKFVQHMLEHSGGCEEAYFLVDALPMPPELIFTIAYFYNKYELNVVLSYGRLVETVFNYDQHVSVEQWRTEVKKLRKLALRRPRRRPYGDVEEHHRRSTGRPVVYGRMLFHDHRHAPA